MQDSYRSSVDGLASSNRPLKSLELFSLGTWQQSPGLAIRILDGKAPEDCKKGDISDYRDLLFKA